MYHFQFCLFYLYTTAVGYCVLLSLVLLELFVKKMLSMRIKYNVFLAVCIFLCCSLFIFSLSYMIFLLFFLGVFNLVNIA